jgi:hypothetical protein
METTNRPALVSVIYAEQSSYSATLRIRSHCTLDDMTTIIHERAVGGPVCYELLPFDDHRDIRVNDCESITIIHRNAGEITAAGVFEVHMALSEEFGAILAPRCIQNLLIDQCDSATIARACDEVISATMMSDLDQVEEVQQ